MAIPISARPPAQPAVTLHTRGAAIAIDSTGALTEVSVRGGGNLLAPGQPAPLLTVRVDGTMYAPQRAEWEAGTHRITLHYGDTGVTAVVSAVAKASHVAFTVEQVQPAGRVELVLWGPYPTSIHDIVGETIGVVRDEEVAVGVQALNPKTIGGYPNAENNDIDAGYTADDPGRYPDLPAELLKDQGWRGDAARATPFGSVVQAYCRDRSRQRIISNWGFERYVAPPFHDGGVVGSSIALFACPASKALQTIGEIEVSEGLPHPVIDGVWGKVSPGATAAYLIVDFGEDNIDRAIEMTRRAGLNYLYHSSPFETWGHFVLKPGLFPHGWDGLKACVEKARASGIRVGFHTLSNFITTNDAYVTPVPDPRLARVGSSSLTNDVNAAQTEIPAASADYFTKSSTLNTVMIGQELIRYKSVSAEAPGMLLGCERGAFGTHAAAHAAGAGVARLADHGYGVFLGDAALSQETARNIAALFNHVGALQTSFDGLEGNQSTALGQYGSSLFTKAWFDALSPELRGHVINDASNPGHYDWHIYTRMNWGEPWYAGFRESQTLYRFKNQVYFERNLTPHMLGWFSLRPETSIEDAEWMLARAAGFDAGFALATSLASTAQLEADPSSADTARRYGATTAILEAVRQWETARMAGAFPPAVKALLRDNTREFHLKPTGKGLWNLYEAHVARFSREGGAAGDLVFRTVNAEQPLQWTITSAAKEPIAGLTVALDGALVAEMRDVPIPAGGSLKYTGGAEAVVCNAEWKELARIPIDAAHDRVAPGEHRLAVRWSGAGGFKAELRTFASPVHIAAPGRRR